MISEVLYLIRKKNFKYLVFFLVLCMCIPILQKQPSNEYKHFYQLYSNQMDQLESSDSDNLVPICDETIYIYDQLYYLRDRENKLDVNIDMYQQQSQSSLFKDDLARIQKNLVYEINRKNASVDLYDTYKNDQLLNSIIPVYFIYITGVFLFLSIIYEDIKNNQIHIFKTYHHNLNSIFWNKLFTYLLFLSGITILLMSIEMICLKGNYSVYNLLSLSSTFKDLTLIQYIIMKYLNTFLNALLITSILFVVIIFIRNEVLGYISFFLLCLIEFLIFKTTKSIVKYYNLYHILFNDRLQYNSVNTTLLIMKVIITLILFGIIYLLYTKEYHLELNFQRRVHFTYTTNMNIHILWELFIRSRGIATIIIILLFSINNYRSFMISNDYKEQNYQSYIQNYIGRITEEKHQKIEDEYIKIQENYQKFLVLEQQIQEHPELTGELLEKNELIFRSAENYENIARLKNEYEMAYQNGLSNFISNRGYTLLLMKNQTILKVEYLCILMIPIVIIYMDFKSRMNSIPYRNIITTSKLGEIIYSQKCDLLFISYITINILSMFIGHIVKIKKYFGLDFSYTLKDVLYFGYNIPLWIFFMLLIIFILIIIFILSKMSYSIIKKVSIN